MANPKIGYNTSVNLNNGGVIAKVISITPPETSIQKVPIDAFDNLSVGGLPVEDCQAGWVSPGEWKFGLYFDKTQWNTLRALIGNQSVPCKVIKSDGSGYAFTGYLAKCTDPIPLKDNMTCEITVQVNGGTIGTFNTVQS